MAERNRDAAAYDALVALMVDSGLPHEIGQLVDDDGIRHTIRSKSRRLLGTVQPDGRKRTLGNQLRKWTKVYVNGEEINVMGEGGGL